MDTYAYRMYFLVPYALTGIQKGIQAGHAAIEYAQFYHDDPEYQQWAKNDKTFILLNGGTMNDNNGTLMKHLGDLQTNKVKVQYFREPDLNDAVSAIALLVDERVFDREQYPLPNPPTPNSFTSWPAQTAPIPKAEQDAYDAQVLRILGTPQNVFLREFLKQFSLAQN